MTDSLPPQFVVAIDGPAGSGKSTLAKKIAAAINAVVIDTGAMYRSVTHDALQKGSDPGDEARVGKIAREIDIRFAPGEGGVQKVFANGVEVTRAIRSPAVNQNVSVVAAQPMVRREMTRLQRRMGAQGRVVMEGRDIGSVVFPDAAYKFFMVADPQVRAERRFREMQEAGESHSTLDAVLANVLERDRIDAGREVAPLVRPDGAIDIDTGNLTIDEVLDKMLACLFS